MADTLIQQAQLGDMLHACRRFPSFPGLQAWWNICTFKCSRDSSFMTYWTGLYPPEMQGKILEGVKALLACVHRAVEVQPGNIPRMLPAVSEENKDEDVADE